MSASPRTGVLGAVVTVLRKALVLVAGSILVLAGLAMVVLPGPGWLTVFAGLALLGREFAWAKRASERLKGVLDRAWAYLRPHVRRLLRRPPLPVDAPAAGVAAVQAPPVVDLADAQAPAAPDVVDLRTEGVPSPREDEGALARSCPSA